VSGLSYFEYPFSGSQVVVSMSEIELTGALSLVSFQPGPAGISTANIGDGISVDVDFAEPGRLCSLDLPLNGLSVEGGQLDGLISAEGRLSIRDLIADPAGNDLRRTSLGPYWSRRPRSIDSGEGATAAGRILTAIDVGDDFDEHPLVRAIARFEVFEAVRIDDGFVSADRLDRSIGYAVAAIENDLQGEQVLTRLNPDQYRQLVGIVSGGGRVHPRFGARISKHIVGLLGDNFRDNGRGIFERSRGGRRTYPSQVAAQFDATADLADIASSSGSNQPGQLADQIETSPPFGEATGPGSTQSSTSMTAWLSSSGRLEVFFTENPNDNWIKVFDPNLSLIAAVPIIKLGSRSGGWHAQAVIPKELSAEDVNIAVTSDPGTRSGDQFERMINAVVEGQSATRLAAAGRTAEASAQWKICAALWNELGDATRSNMALAYAHGERQVTQIAQLHDAVRALI